MGDDWNESLEVTIKSAAGDLPEGYQIQLNIEKNGLAASIILPDDIAISVDRDMVLVDEIRALVELAIKHSGERKPLTREQLHFQRWAD